ncbi:YeeE/YedE family protein [Volucribacter amazonae]|uniref:Transporter n=1 Tax=Volucribacter amazonae TaxID=256731 RepID=A0A9X4SLH0_9PAST|nr:YeeE/YedE family protein [Volucribacter amazonae]MDG6896159.1 transporter [Volucribacter amazonae]
MFISGLFVGLLLGFILQRGQFCLSAQLRNIAFQPNLVSFTPLLLAIAIQSIGFFLLEHFHLITFPRSPMPILATLLGAFLFGVGMAIAHRCITGQLYRAGEGLISSWLVLAIFALTTTMCQTGPLKFSINTLLISPHSQLVTLPQSFALSPLFFIIPLCLLSLFACYHYQKTQKKPFFPKQILQQTWSPLFTATLLGLLSILAWYLSAKTGREFGLSFSIPLANSLQYATTGQQRYLNWGTYLVIGIIIGSAIAAWLSGKCLWRAPSPQGYLQAIIGGVCMGIGASLAGGCTMANTVVATAYFSWQGWIASLMMIIGLICVERCKQRFFTLHKQQ